MGEEVTIDIQEGKTLIIKLNAIGKVRKDGTRTIYFELNGMPRSAVVTDLSVESDVAARVKAEPGNDSQVGAPMPGKIFKLLVSVGDQVKKGETLLATEAMKMETNVKAMQDGVIKEILSHEGDQVEQGDLLVVFE